MEILEKPSQISFTVSFVCITYRSKPLSISFQSSCNQCELPAKDSRIVASSSDLTVAPYTLRVFQG